MIDGIELWLGGGNIDIGLLDRPARADTNTFSGNVGNMRIRQTLGGVFIAGSLPKFLNGQNIGAFTRADVRAARERLEVATGLDLTRAQVKRLEFGACVIVKNRPHEYIRLFGRAVHKKRHETSSYSGLEGVSYFTKTGAYKFTAYDKAKEASEKGMSIPELYRGLNILRLEYSIRRRGIMAKFRRDLTAYDLYDHDVYHRLRSLFLECYAGIDKVGRRCFIDKSKPITPKELQEAEAEQWRQLHPKEYEGWLQGLREEGALTGKSLERIRAAERKNRHNVNISEASPFITELDTKIKKVILEGA
jgi:hypothetical protein